MKLTLRQQITQFAHVLQTRLFPSLEEELGELSGSAKRLVATLEMIPLARFVPAAGGWIGRPSKGPPGDRQRLRGQGGLRVHHHQTVAGEPPAGRSPAADLWLEVGWAGAARSHVFASLRRVCPDAVAAVRA